MEEDTDFVRQHLPIILDVPEKLAANPVRSKELLNLVTTLITEAIEKDVRVQAALKRTGIEWGWEKGTWE